MSANAGVPMGRWEDKATDQRIRAAGILLITPDKRALFLRRSGQGDHPGEWALPGGGVEPHEIPIQAALRELYEETGIKGIDISKVKVASHTVNADVDFTTFMVEVPKALAPRLNDEHNGHAWVPLEDPPKPTHPGVTKTIKELTSPAKDERVDKGDTVRDTIKYPVPKNEDAWRAVDLSFKRGQDERYEPESIAPKAEELNSTTMDALRFSSENSLERFVLQHGRPFGSDVALSDKQSAVYKKMAPAERAQVDKTLKATNTSDPKTSSEHREVLDQLLGKAYGVPGADADKPDKLQQATFPAFLMCAPFSLSTDKPDNVWMEELKSPSKEHVAFQDHEIDKNLAFKEWMEMYQYIAQRALVYVLPSEAGLQDQVYVANLGLVLPHKKDKEVVVANFKAPPRRGEDRLGLEFFKLLGYTVTHAPKYWEGEAECKYLRDNIFFGAHGIRSNKASIDWLEKTHDMQIVPIKMIEERLYHLDTLLFPLTSDKVITCTEFIEPEDVKAIEKVAEIIDINKEDTLRGLTCGIKLGNVYLCNTLLETLKEQHDPELYRDEVHKKETIEKICADNGLECRLFNLSEAEKSGADLACHIMHLNWVELNAPTGSAIKPQ